MRKNSALRNVCAEVMDQRFVGNTVKAVAPDSRVEVAAGKGESGSNFWNRLVKSVVKACELRGFGEDRLGGGDQLQSLRNVQGREVSGRPHFIQHLRRDELVLYELRPSMDYPVSDSQRAYMNMFPDRRRKNIERMALRFMNTLALGERRSVGGTNVQRAIIASNAFRTSGQQRLFIARFHGNRRRT